MSFKSFQERLGISFENEDLLKHAFVHRSAINESEHLNEDNERLEFLGDAVLELITTEHLYINYDKDEGELTNLRSSIVKRDTLAFVAREVGLGEFIYLSKGEKKSNGHEKDYILANTLEALIGAIYLDQGYDVAKGFIERNILIKLETILKEKSYIDHKTQFQERAQEIAGTTPEYKLVFEEGPDHEKIFTMGVFLGENFVAEGKGPSKQSAEQEAAYKALIEKQWIGE